MLVRDATVDDLPAIRALYNALIPTTTIAWRDELASQEEVTDWYAERTTRRDPVLVAELDGEVAGYTTWGSFRGGDRFPGYRHTVELTIHVDGRWHRQGVGRALLTALIERAGAQQVHVLVAGIDADNGASIDLHRAVGFVEVGRMPEVGRKHGRWLDLVLLQQVVGTRAVGDDGR